MVNPVVKNYVDQVTKKWHIGGTLVLENHGLLEGMAPIRQYKWTAEEAAVADTDGVANNLAMGAAANTVSAGFGAIPCARNVTMVPSASMGTTKKVKVTGLDIAGNVIEEELTFNNSSAVVGNKAFASVISVLLPIQEHTPAKQTEYITFDAEASGTSDCTLKVEDTVITGAGAITLTLAATAAAHDTVTKVAQAFADLINADETLSAKYVASIEAGKLTITALEFAANDTALAFTFSAGTSGITASAGTQNGTAGVAVDNVDIGFGDKLGLPLKLAGVHHIGTYLNGSAENTAPTFATSATALESNTVDLNSSLDGTSVETLFIQR